MEEFALIRHLTDRPPGRRTVAETHLVVGIGDDAAVTELTPGMHLVLSCDTMVQDVHFNSKTMSLYDIGWKAVASNVSDMAAMGAVPRTALVALTVPASVPADRLRELYAGLYACADRYGVALAGGDTTSTPGGLTVTVTVTGEVEPGRALLRSAARPGDAVFVTGWPGRSAAGLHALLAAGARPEAAADEPVPEEEFPPPVRGLVAAHRRPEPSVAAGRRLLAGGAAPALNDISDGLSSEAWEIAEASGCGLLLREADIPVAPELKAYADAVGASALEWILTGGEDYVLLGTLPEEAVAATAEAFAAEGLPFFRIGTATSAFAGVRLVGIDGEERRVAKSGYNHFG
ncbi:thiamine-phosphate kinase [Paenibacillus sp. CC-CFT747]|nr:thiamine-phosphate kinase [Paenibacillus sp. CC-CFT747]